MFRFMMFLYNMSGVLRESTVSADVWLPLQVDTQVVQVHLDIKMH